jgi:hypothetical protein
VAGLLPSAVPPYRAAATLLVLVLHAILIAAFLRMTIASPPADVPMREMVLWFVPAPHPKPPVPKERANTSVRHRTVSSPRFPEYPAITAPPPPAISAPGLEGLHAFLFNCALENLANLTPEQRAQCAGTVPKSNDSVDYADHTNRSKDAQLWARRRARKNGPLLLPCASPYGISPLGTLMCLGKSAITGKLDLDAMPQYGDRPEEVHVPNGGDPPDGPRR